MTKHLVWIVALATAFAACGESGVGPPEERSGNSDTGAAPALSSIAGEYALASVAGVALPCCSRDSAGTTITLAAGSLTLDSLPADEWVNTPGAGETARSCVHQIPSGAVLDTGGVVRLPDGSSYVIPKCGAPYTLRLSFRRVGPDGVARTAVTTSSDRYVWGGDRLRAFSAPVGSGGQLGVSAKEIALTLSPRTNMGPFSEPAGPEYRFTHVR